MTDDEIRQQKIEYLARWFRDYYVKEPGLEKIAPQPFFIKEWLNEEQRHLLLVFVEEILAIEDEQGNRLLELRHPDQRLPENPHAGKGNIRLARSGGYTQAQLNMLEAGFVRVIPLEEGEPC